VGWELGVPIAAGALAGYSLDQRYHTGAAVTAVLLLLGVLVGWYNVVRLIRLATRRDLGRAHDQRDGVL
jgi:F0F1-type ATP synthase assembly protein I